MKRKSFYALGLAAVVALTSNTAAFAAMQPGSQTEIPVAGPALEEETETAILTDTGDLSKDESSAPYTYIYLNPEEKMPEDSENQQEQVNLTESENQEEAESLEGQESSQDQEEPENPNDIQEDETDDSQEQPEELERRMDNR